jgi:hypothetical protein
VSARYGETVRQSLRWWLAASALVAYLPILVTATQSPAAGANHTSCHAPRVIGLTVTAARSRAKSSNCQLRLTGASVQMPRIQTIRTQSARPGALIKLLSVTVNPLCPGSANLGPPHGEPLLTPGTSGLTTGLFIEGGAFLYRSVPVCKNLVGKSSAGTITVINSVGVAIANQTALTAGQLLEVNLNAGQYTITGVFANGVTARPVSVTIPPGEVVRQDLVLDVP